MTIAETANWVYMLSGHTHPKRRSGISHGHPTSPPRSLTARVFPSTGNRPECGETGVGESGVTMSDQPTRLMVR